MIRKISMAVLPFLIFSFTSLWAQGNIKIGVVSYEKILQNLDEWAQMQKELDMKRQQYERELARLYQERDSLAQKYQEWQNSPLTTPAALSDLEEQFKQKTNEIIQYEQTRQAELLQLQNENSAKLKDKIDKVVAEIGKEEDFTLIFDKQLVIYVADAEDLTFRVLDRLSRK